jgi:hypothetical protein
LILKASRSACTRRRRRRRRMGEEGKRVGICIRYSWQERECTCEGKLIGFQVFSLYRQFISNRTIFILCHPCIMRSFTNQSFCFSWPGYHPQQEFSQIWLQVSNREESRENYESFAIFCSL